MMKLDGPHTLPRVTILTPTKNRPGFLRQCARYIAEQTYPKHLLDWVIVNGGEEIPFEGSLSEALTIEGGGSLEIPGKGLSLGMMRNEGVKVAKGDIIVHFDDDDWHAADRVERQVVPFLAKPQLELVATDDYYVGLFHKNPVMACHSVTWGLDRFASGGTFAYRKRAWRQNPFANIPSGEDYLFARGIRQKQGLAINLRDPTLFICVRHGKNTAQADVTLEVTSKPGIGEHVKGLMGLSNFEMTRVLAMTSGS